MRARKRFGQHFLSDEGVLQQLTQAIALTPGQQVLEIGPGMGALTAYLIAAAETDYTAIEIDRDLVPLLQQRFPSIRIINSDVLEVVLETVLTDSEQGWRVVGNLPYNISSPLILKYVLHSYSVPGRIRDMHFMLQKEMADRMRAQPGTKAWGRLSVMVQVFAEVEGLFDVLPSSFTPPPQVDSAVVRIVPRRDVALPAQLQTLDRVLRLAFSARRKRLSNALKTLNIDWSAVQAEPQWRADDVGLSEFLQIAQWAEEHSQR
ncbi:MAG: 16S rRNA (adenine(1518)-N(6)/adenine(1519)-N(6))-dimethyltransferase RsmA [Gammaproteobacteria bacterium TMED92]|nr:MAG: 16S rRNA (adenine(1518)-N(6)/adenine(1519)-N(6))-dimethyltransferase RsmA [Gammaproteobacteria bacterium TMED92]